MQSNVASSAPTASTISCDVSSNGPSETDFVHGGVTPDLTSGAILTPIVQSATYVQKSVERYLESGYSYSRCGNPTVAALEKKIAMLECGVEAAAFSSGMAATVAVLCALLKTGDHCIMTQCSYGGTNRAARVMFKKMYGIEFSFVNFSNIDEIEKAIIPGKTKLIFSETPCNPVLQLADVEAISELAKKYSKTSNTPYTEVLAEGEGPSREALHDRIIHACDSTMATPYILRPLQLGADLVVQSTTKFYDGHNMLIGGAVCSKEKEIMEIIKFHQNVLGSIMTPQIAFYLLQTSKTLPLRVKQQSISAMTIATFLEKHPKVESVSYPGLPSHPQHALALRQHQNNIHGGMLCFEVKGGSAAGRNLMNAIQAPWTLAENLGATESIITCPSVFTHANMTKEDRLKVGITDGLVRLSVGIEDVNDLISALSAALEKV